jgi:hypothetical protein
VWVYDTYKKFVSIPDHSVYSACIEYFTYNNKEYTQVDDVWSNEVEKWDGSFSEHYMDLTGIDYRKTTVPENVKKTIIRVKYWYNDKLYKYITYNMNHEWPPHNKNGIVFNIPLISAEILDQDDKPVKDILKKVKRYAGPRGDFHGERVKISDMLYYDMETLKSEYPKIKLKNALGKVKILSTHEDYITDLRVF